MFKLTRCLCVVFTQSYPMLEIFANQHFLPTHPLRHHPLWLDENDFHQNQFIAKLHNKPHPFKIDPYAHHPQFSPYAVKGKRKLKATKKEQSSEEKSSTDNSIIMNKKQNREQIMLTTALSSKKNVSKEQYKIPICVGTVYPRIYYFNLEQMYVRVGSNNDSNNFNFNTLSSLHNINYLPESFNSEEKGNSFTETDKRGMNDYAYSSRDDLNPYKTLSAIEEASERRLEQLKQNNMYSPLIEEGMKLLRSIYPTPPHCKGALSVLSGKRYPYQLGSELEKRAQKYGYRSPWWGTLKQWSKVDATVLPGEESHDIPFCRNTKLVHISLLSNAEEVLQNSYISASKGYLRYINPFESEDLNVDDVDLLNNLMESSSLTSNSSSDDFMDDESSFTSMYNGSNKREEMQVPTTTKKKLFLSAIIKDIKQHNYKIPLYLSPKYILRHKLELREDAEGVNIEPFNIVRSFIDRDCTIDKDNSALISPALTIQEHSDFDLRQSKTELIRFAEKRRKNATNSSTTNEHQDQNEEKEHEQTKHNKSNFLQSDNNYNLPSHWNPTKLAHQTKSAVQVRHYYHLSQVRFPETFSLPAEVLAAELSSPCVPLHGLTGEALTFNELHIDNLIRTMPEVAALINEKPHYTHFRSNSSHDTNTNINDTTIEKNATDNNVENNATLNSNQMSISETNSMNELSPEEIDEYVIRNRSPKQHHGRHLWFTAKDILEHNGLVDVNATPVEVLVRTSHSTNEMPDCQKITEKSKQVNSDDEDDDDDITDKMNIKSTPLFHHMYNVSCLTHPEHALKLINNYFHEEKVEFAQTRSSHEE